MSILNLNSKINAKIKNSFHFGSLEWNGEDPSKINLNDVPKIAKIKIGDSIVSGGMSSIFPENLPIGVVSKIDLKNSENYYGIDVLLNNDMTSIKNVYIINNPDKKEIDNLKNLINE
jgi:rod shape-determining protein MreC